MFPFRDPPPRPRLGPCEPAPGRATCAAATRRSPPFGYRAGRAAAGSVTERNTLLRDVLQPGQGSERRAGAQEQMVQDRNVGHYVDGFVGQVMSTVVPSAVSMWSALRRCPRCQRPLHRLRQQRTTKHRAMRPFAPVRTATLSAQQVLSVTQGSRVPGTGSSAEHNRPATLTKSSGSSAQRGRQPYRR